MNGMAMIEYLLKKYAYYSKMADKSTIQTAIYSFLDKAEMAEEIIRERFCMRIKETDTEYIAFNSVCEVRVKKER